MSGASAELDDDAAERVPAEAMHDLDHGPPEPELDAVFRTVHRRVAMRLDFAGGVLP